MAGQPALHIPIIRWIPAPLRRPLGRGRAYVRRLAIWLGAARAASGVSAADRAVLRRALVLSPVTSARNLDRWQDPVLPADAEVRIRGIGRFHIRAGTDDFWHVLPGREPAIIAALRRHLRPGDVFIDAGANIGFYTVLGARIVGPRGRVVAVEMLPETAGLLRGHIARNGLPNVEVVEAALAARSGLEMAAAVPAGKFGQASIAVAHAGAAQFAVSTTTLADVVADIPSVRLIKLDLEGAEADALLGAAPILDRVDAIIFESHTGLAQIVGQLAAAGFEMRTLDARNMLAVRAGADG